MVTGLMGLLCQFIREMQVNICRLQKQGPYLYHDSLEEEIPFGCISEMAICLEKLFDELRYPMKSVDHRSFVGIKHGSSSLRCGVEAGKKRVAG